jgi:ubiquitin
LLALQEEAVMVGLRKVTHEIRQTILYLDSLGVPHPKIASQHLKGQISRVTVWRIVQEAKQNVTKQDVSKEPHEVVDKDFQIEHYQPTLASSFNGGLGTPTPRRMLQKVIQQIAGNLSAYERKVAEIQLRHFVSDKDVNKALGQLREHLSDRMEEIFGFDPSSDKDQQFADLNDLAKFLIRASKDLGQVKLKPRQLVDALLVKIYGQKAAQVIEATEKHLKCPRCRKPRSFVVDKNPNFYLCMSCGKQVPLSNAKFKVTQHKVDGRYLRTVENLFPLSTASVRSIPSQSMVEVKG